MYSGKIAVPPGGGGIVYSMYNKPSECVKVLKKNSEECAISKYPGPNIKEEK
jgi:hypothetical protein